MSCKKAAPQARLWLCKRLGQSIHATKVPTARRCNAGHFTINLWLLSCANQLVDRGAADAPSRSCTCQLGDPQRYTCPTSSTGFQATASTQPGRWYYVVVQANPPDTGADPPRNFQLSVSRA